MPRSIQSRSSLPNQLDLGKPGAVGRRVVQMDARMFRKPGVDLECFVGREVIQDDVDLFPPIAARRDSAGRVHQRRGGGWALQTFRGYGQVRQRVSHS